MRPLIGQHGSRCTRWPMVWGAVLVCLVQGCVLPQATTPRVALSQEPRPQPHVSQPQTPQLEVQQPQHDTQNQKPTYINGIPTEYLIGAGDILEVLVWGNESLSRVLTVRPDGKISLPLINDVQASGVTPMQLKEQIASRLRAFKELPEVSIIVVDAKSQVIYLLGQVVNPGPYPLGPNTTVLQVIAQAGGFTPFADRNSIIVIRKGDGKRKEQRIRVSYQAILAGRPSQGNVALHAGDTIIVP